MGRRRLELLPRLLSKIEVQGIADPLWLEEYVGRDLPDELKTPPWRWIGAAAARRIVKTYIKRADGSRAMYYYNRGPAPSFKVDGKGVKVHRLIFSLFRQVQSPRLHFHKSPVDYMDVNPSHWTMEDRPRTPKRETVHEFDEVMAGLIETIGDRWAMGKPLTTNLPEAGYTPEQIIAALIAVNPPTLHKYLTRTPEGSYAITPHEEGRS